MSPRISVHLLQVVQDTDTNLGVLAFLGAGGGSSSSKAAAEEHHQQEHDHNGIHVPMLATLGLIALAAWQKAAVADILQIGAGTVSSSSSSSSVSASAGVGGQSTSAKEGTAAVGSKSAAQNGSAQQAAASSGGEEDEWLQASTMPSGKARSRRPQRV